MALNNNLNGVLNNIVNDVAPVIKLSNGLYSLVDKSSVVPSETEGTNLKGGVVDNCMTSDTIIWYFELLGNWSASYYYMADIRKWGWTEK